MNGNPPSPELSKALLVAQNAMPDLHFDATNPHFGSKFVSLPGLLNQVRPILNGAGLVLNQFPTLTLDGHQGLRTRITHAETGQYIEDTMPLLLSKQDAQGQGSAITYARRYALMSMLGLAGDEDDDGHQASAATRSGSQAPERGRATRPAPDKPRGFLPGADQPNIALKRAQEAQAAKGDVPTDAGDPRNETVHFGKNAGKTLGELGKRSVEWYATKWAPNDTPKDRRLQLAAQMMLGLAPEDIPADPDDEIPF